MKILIVFPGQVPVYLYGGTQRVLWGLGKELSNLGHRVSFLVKEGSYCDFANVIPIDENKSILEQIDADFDVVHFHYDPKDIEKTMFISQFVLNCTTVRNFRVA